MNTKLKERAQLMLNNPKLQERVKKRLLRAIRRELSEVVLTVDLVHYRDGESRPPNMDDYDNQEDYWTKRYEYSQRIFEDNDTIDTFLMEAMPEYWSECGEEIK